MSCVIIDNLIIYWIILLATSAPGERAGEGGPGEAREDRPELRDRRHQAVF